MTQGWQRFWGWLSPPSRHQSPWGSESLIREELFSAERLEQHACSLALAQPVSQHPCGNPWVLPLARRLQQNGAMIRHTYGATAQAVRAQSAITPAAEWLLDNYHIVEEQIREIYDDLPPSYYRQLPKLSEGPLGGYPRVLGMAWAFVAHTDSLFDAQMLGRFVRAYQTVQPLEIGELWAIAITLRIVLIDNLRRAAVQITTSRHQREQANTLADQLLGTNTSLAEQATKVLGQRNPLRPLPTAFAAQLIQRLREQDPKVTPALVWLEAHLSATGTNADDVVRLEHQSQGAANLTVQNIITSMRLISNLDWTDWFEGVSLVDDVLRTSGDFARMDFATHNLYRTAIEKLARGSARSELQIAHDVVAMATADHSIGNATDPGYWLIGAGRRAYEQQIHYRAPWATWLSRGIADCGIAGYSTLVGLSALAILAVPLWVLFRWHLPWHGLLGLAVLGLIPAIGSAMELVNRGITGGFQATLLPSLDLSEGVPADLRTMVVMPTLLTSFDSIAEHLERLEVHYLGNPESNLYFALLSDWADANTEKTASDDAWLQAAAQGIAQLNQQYGLAAGGPRFFLLHRRRQWNSAQGCWMGWERKRGKLHALNHWLQGRCNSHFMALDGQDPSPPEGVRYVITLDSDTKLPLETAWRLIGKMAHPLNQPRFEAAQGRVVSGYGILQPRVTPSLPTTCQGSPFQRIFSRASGIDPYASAVSDVYQDLFGEGSYAGKGIYDVAAFEAALHGRVPDNSLLSHDLFEGIFARAGLVSDVEVVEEFPSRYDVHVARQHRWCRGDWQLLPWLLGLSQSPNASQRHIPAIGRWKMLDNLRRTLSAPCTFWALLAGWLLPWHGAALWSGFMLLTIALPALIPLWGALWPRGRKVNVRHHGILLAEELSVALAQTGLTLSFLAHQAWMMSDAIARTLFRLVVSHRYLLEWVTAAQATVSQRLSLRAYARLMSGGVMLGVLGITVLGVWRPENGLLMLPGLLLWVASPAIARWISLTPNLDEGLVVSAEDAQTLRLIARRTWRFFETFVTAQDHWLPPDNFQETPQPVIAHRTSPTNMGLYLLSAVTARDFGWASTAANVARIEATLATMGQLERFHGHFYNWYDTQDCRPLDPPYISSVDSGNLAGHLITLANACREWVAESNDSAPRWQGVLDNLTLTLSALKQLPNNRRTQISRRTDLEAQLNSLVQRVNHAVASPNEVAFALQQPAQTMLDMATTMAYERGDLASADMLYWAEATQQAIMAHLHESTQSSAERQALHDRLALIETTARSMAEAMAFGFLLDPDRKLLSIGYSIQSDQLDHSCYDLLASEARLASFVAIAKGDVPQRHWFRLGRGVTPIQQGAALISWSGSMFEYLMPALVMQAPRGSLVETTNRLVVARQKSYVKALGIPWGISESAYNTRDLELTYQYSNFGVPGLGLKRGLGDNRVIAPYATALATMVDPKAATQNFVRLAAVNALGRFGFYEALDYTPSRLPEGKSVAVIRAYMAHHQGMTIVAIANALQGGAMRRRFHAEPMVQAAELLLQERTPRDIAVSTPRAEEVHSTAMVRDLVLPVGRRMLSGREATHAPTPMTHLLSNGRYTVMLTSAGSGYSQWQQQGPSQAITALTRWHEDVTCDDWGAYLFVRDIHRGQVWSAGYQPCGITPDHYVVTFREDRAKFVRRDGPITTTLEVMVSPEDNAEVRRVTLANADYGAHTLELTSYAELVLAPYASDRAHPAFSKLFVQTEYLPKLGAILATRRRRSPDEPEVWVAHLAVVEGQTVGEVEVETDRARFIGRGHETRDPVAVMDGQPLSNTVGTVLDPILALRRRVVVPPGGLVRMAFWTVVATSRDEVLDLVDKHHDAHAYERLATLAWTQAQVQRHYLGIDPDEASLFQELGGHVLYTNPRMRPMSDTIQQGAGGPSGLWAHSISGDIPIVLVRIDAIENVALVRQVLRAHEYLRMKQLAFDLVILNEHSSSYVQDLQVALETLVRTSQSRPSVQAMTGQGAGSSPVNTVFILRADLMASAARALLLSVARVVLDSRRGTLAEQLHYVRTLGGGAAGPSKNISSRLPDRPLRGLHQESTLVRLPLGAPPAVVCLHGSVSDGLREGVRDWATKRLPVRDLRDVLRPESRKPVMLNPVVAPELAFFNGLGGFDDTGREYVVQLLPGQSTPAPWINVIANPTFGFQVAAEGTGYTWSQNSRENQLTAWSNDPVSNRPGEVLYVRDEDTGKLWGPTALPIRDNESPYTARHGQGYSQFEHSAHGIALSLCQFVPLDDPVKISRLTLKNTTGQVRRLSVTAYVAWVLGTFRSQSAPFILTEVDAASGTLMAKNPWNAAFAGRVAFMTLAGDVGTEPAAWTGDRQAFVGRNGTLANPVGLMQRKRPLPKRVGAGLDPCGVLQTSLTLKPNQTLEVVFLLGEAESFAAAQALVAQYGAADLEAVLQSVHQHWDEVLGTIQVKTPDPAMDVMLNRWLLYQTLVCRIWARSAFYQASGAYGFRDQLQDGMALVVTQPELTREHLLRAAARQFVEGDTQHWWLPASGQGVRTRISDDRIWLAYATAHYVEVTGDAGVLDEAVPFLDGQALEPGAHDVFFQPSVTAETATLFEHCARGLDHALALGAHGLPLIGTGDWNDGMNRVGEGGQGESVWLGWFLYSTLTAFIPLAKTRQERPRAAQWLAHRKKLQRALERHGWDGDWYRRGYFDDGTPLGSSSSSECQIDAIAQSWSVLSGAGDPARALHAMAAVEKHLIRQDEGLALLFSPPFDKTTPTPGYIQGYPPGVRENGGQYTHAATWTIMALAQLGQGDKAAALFALMNPINHSNTRVSMQRYKTEPYVVAADVYSIAPHTGRGGWTWYTGAAGWMYRAGIESILGFRQQGAFLHLNPCIPKHWPRFELVYRYHETRYEITVENPYGVNQGIATATLDDELIIGRPVCIRLQNDAQAHHVMIRLGT